MKEIIQKFDTDMLMKSNKSDLVVLKNMIEDDYMKNGEWKEINDINRKLQMQIDSLN